MTLMYSKPRWSHVMMELANRAVNLVKFVCSTLYLIIAFVVIYQIRSVDCGIFPSSLTAKSYNTSDGRLCYMCAPGQFWLSDCIRSGEVAICQPCAKGYFQTVENHAKTCKECTTYCTQQNQEYIEVCNSTTDNICQCSSGYFMTNTEGFCIKHRTCAPGEGVTSPGNKDRDTICESCIEGKTFSINESATEGCLPCTRCDVKGLYEMTPCTIKSDAHCVTSKPPDVSHSIGAIVGGILGTLIVVFIILAVIWYLKRHRQNSQSSGNDSSEFNPFINQPGPSTLDGNNSNHNPGELQVMEYTDQDERSKGVEIKSSEVLSDSKKSISSASSHKGIRLSVLTKLSNDLISANWKFFFRELSVTENQIQQVENDYCRNVQEQIYQLLLHLNQKGTLTKSSIIEALETVNRNDLAAKYSEEEFYDS